MRNRYIPKRVSASTVVTVVSGSCILHGIHLNASSGQILIWDKTSAGLAASAIAIIASGVATVPSDILDMELVNGLTVSTSAANSDFTLLYTTY